VKEAIARTEEALETAKRNGDTEVKLIVGELSIYLIDSPYLYIARPFSHDLLLHPLSKASFLDNRIASLGTPSAYHPPILPISHVFSYRPRSGVHFVALCTRQHGGHWDVVKPPTHTPTFVRRRVHDHTLDQGQQRSRFEPT
jgi:hypothetical protein